MVHFFYYSYPRGVELKYGDLLKKTIFLFCVTLFFSACLQKSEQKRVQEIRQFEFQRTANPVDFEPYITEENANIRLALAEAIARIGNPVHLHVLNQLLRDQNSDVVDKAIFALGQIEGQDSSLIALYQNISFKSHKKQIITSMGTTGSSEILRMLLTDLSHLPDSLKIAAIKSITFLVPANLRDRKTINILKNELNDSNADIRGAAAYFFSRHPSTSTIHSLARIILPTGSTADKYRMKAINTALKNYYIQPDDSLLADTLRTRVLNDLNSEGISWRHKLYEIDMLSHFGDSLAFKTAVRFLNDSIPHLRNAAIKSLVHFDTLEAKNILLATYINASWADKGEIILALSKKSPEVTYSLVQQNLDKGNTHFKQLLLESLGVINSRMAISQLYQFLHVPNIRLKSTAFNILWKLRYIGYKEVKEFLSSGDLALTSLAANWIIEHPEWAKYEDLTTAYEQFKESSGAEVMIDLIKAIEKINSVASIDYLKNIYRNTSSYVVAEQSLKSLRKSGTSVNQRNDLKVSLYMPSHVIFNNDTIKALLQTEKGEIVLGLWPFIAPATVSNFIQLADSGFYENLTFHRVVSDFVIQGGDPRGDGWGGPEYSIPSEYSEKPFKRGTLGIATAGKDTGSSQFFICHSEQPHLDGHFTVWGEVIKGMEIVDQIEIDDKIIQVIIQK